MYMDDPAQTPVPQPVNPGDDLAQLTKDPLPTFADEVTKFDQEHPQGKFKEQLEALGRNTVEKSTASEKPVTDIEVIPHTPEIDPAKEIASYVEKIEKEGELTQNITDDYTQQVLLKSSANQNPTITLPLTEEQVKQGLHHKVWEAVRWLAVWCIRQAQLLPGRVKYKQ